MKEKIVEYKPLYLRVATPEDITNSPGKISTDFNRLILNEDILVREQLIPAGKYDIIGGKSGGSFSPIVIYLNRQKIALLSTHGGYRIKDVKKPNRVPLARAG